VANRERGRRESEGEKGEKKEGAPPLLRLRTGGLQAPWPHPAAGDAPAALGLHRAPEKKGKAAVAGLAEEKKEKKEKKEKEEGKERKEKGVYLFGND